MIFEIFLKVVWYQKVFYSKIEQLNNSAVICKILSGEVEVNLLLLEFSRWQQKSSRISGRKSSQLQLLIERIPNSIFPIFLNRVWLRWKYANRYKYWCSSIQTWFTTSICCRWSFKGWRTLKPIIFNPEHKPRTFKPQTFQPWIPGPY